MTAQRALMPDYLRLFALFGIVVVNVQFMAYPIEQGFVGATHQGPADAVAAWLVGGLALLKSYGLFSFMFGVGLAFQMRSAERRGLAFGQLYRNRMIGLALFGLVHGLLFFPGDILVVYAITGAILYRVRAWPAGRLIRLGTILLVVQLVLTMAMMTAFPTAPTEAAELERYVMTEGSMAQVMGFRAVIFAIAFIFVLLSQGLAALGWFCLGLAAVKSGLIDEPGHPVWQQARRWCLVPGVALSLAAAAVWQWRDPLMGELLVVLVAPLTTLGYLGLIAALARPPGPFMARLLTAGGSSLTVYLGQSIVLSTIFAPYGLGLWDGVGPAAAVLTAIGVTIVLIAFVALWRTRFAQGPFEWALRWISRRGVETQKG
ncbi:MAG: DUF418 domain-containing protein [Roseitalea sp.]|jgi:uncharacterized protein|nr:DUF418 domain-containing protein [Roseitalea sp.]MBO6721593.1 DUF418 domain-containing protein [Roseitalea sp.]MBO6743349.1 DUF418 domain-containing protein [Roseitalea sp.]